MLDFELLLAEGGRSRRNTENPLIPLQTPSRPITAAVVAMAQE